jgi:ribosomal protein S12 methylthiotransferase accessory factor YcaO
MPFKSKKQMRWMFANDPEMAKRWAKHTEDIKALPEKTKPKKEEVKEALANLERNLFNDVINLALAKQAAGIPVASRPLPAKKPVTANQPNAVSSNRVHRFGCFAIVINRQKLKSNQLPQKYKQPQ